MVNSNLLLSGLEVDGLMLMAFVLQEPAPLLRLKPFLSCIQKPLSAATWASPVMLSTSQLMMSSEHTLALTPALVRILLFRRECVGAQKNRHK